MVGCGNIAGYIADSFEGAEGATLVGASDVVEGNAREFAAEYDIEAWHTDHGTMFAEREPDVAIVATPNGAHADVVVDAARTGVNVLCQKPLEIHVGELDRMVEACDDHDVTFGALMNSRFRADAQAAKHAVEAGVLGDVMLANGICPVWRSADYFQGWHGSTDLDGGVLFSQAIHLVDRLAWLNDGIERVFADLDTAVHDIEVEDVASVQVRYGNGARGTITASTATRNYPHYDRLDLHGEAGHLVAGSGEVLSFDSDDGDELDFENPDDRGGFTIQVEDMAEAVREGRGPLVTGHEARHPCDAVAAMHASNERNEPVVVDEYVAEVRETTPGGEASGSR
jgi:predicted dehydrogenase